jgi:tetratricopeptide (TPR) repeat protein
MDYLRRVRLYQASNTLLGSAIELLECAISLDSGFALAKVRLAETHVSVGILAGGDSVHYRMADSILGSVLAENPSMPEAMAGQGYLRQVQGNLEAALRLLRQAAAMRPNDAVVLGRLTYVQSLRLDTMALVTGAQAVALAPRDPDMLRRVIIGTSIFRDYDRLGRYSDELIALEPGDYVGHLHKALVALWARGDTGAALAHLRRAETTPGGPPAPVAWAYSLCGPSGWRRWHALSLGDLVSADYRDSISYHWTKAQIAAAEGLRRTERAHAESLLTLVRGTTPSDFFYIQALIERAYARAVRGERDSARRDLATAREIMDRGSPVDRTFFQDQQAAAYAALGDIPAALLAARRLLEYPTVHTRHTLALAPEFARLWGSSEFQSLLADTTLP